MYVDVWSCVSCVRIVQFGNWRRMLYVFSIVLSTTTTAIASNYIVRIVHQFISKKSVEVTLWICLAYYWSTPSIPNVNNAYAEDRYVHYSWPIPRPTFSIFRVACLYLLHWWASSHHLYCISAALDWGTVNSTISGSAFAVVWTWCKRFVVYSCQIALKFK